MVVVAATAGCVPWGDDVGDGPWLGSLLAPIAIFDADVVDTGSIEVTSPDGDAAVLGDESHATATVDDVEVLAEFASNPYDRELFERFSSMASASAPIVIATDGNVRLAAGQRYRIVLRHFIRSNVVEGLDVAAVLVWDLDDDRPADGQSADGWGADLDRLRSAGLVDGRNADVLVTIADAMSTSTPTVAQRAIIVELLGESMLPTTQPSTPMSSPPPTPASAP